MVDGFVVRSESKSATTEANGRAQLVLPPGRRSISATHIGFAPKRVAVLVIRDRTITVSIDVEMQGRGSTPRSSRMGCRSTAVPPVH